MATAFSSLRARIRIRIKERDTRTNVFSVPEIDSAMADAYLALQARLPAARLYTSGAGTIAANADTFTLPTASSAQYQGDVSIQLDSDKSFLRKVTREEIDAMREGAATSYVVRPRYWAPWEEDGQEVVARCYPRAEAAETYHLFAAMVADDLRVAAMDAASVELSRYGETAFIYTVAAELVAAMRDEDLAAKRLDKGVVQVWQRIAEVALYQEEARLHDMADVGRQQRWLA